MMAVDSIPNRYFVALIRRQNAVLGFTIQYRMIGELPDGRYEIQINYFHFHALGRGKGGVEFRSVLTLSLIPSAYPAMRDTD